FIELHSAESGNFKQRGRSPPIARDVTKGLVVFCDRFDVHEGLFRLAFGKKSRSGFQLERLRKGNLGNRGCPVTDLAAARAYLHFDYHHVAGTTDALGFDRLTGFEENALGPSRLGDYDYERKQGGKRCQG